MLQIIINLPIDSEIPREQLSFSPSENLTMLQVGIKAVLIMKDNIVLPEIGDYNENLRNQLKQNDLEKTTLKMVFEDMISNERRMQSKEIEDRVRLEKDKIDKNYKDMIEQYNRNNILYQEKIDKLNESINLSKIDFSDLNMELVKKNERDMLRDLHLESEINIKIKDKEDDKNKEVERYKELFFKAEKDFMVGENTYKILENEKIEKLNLELSVTKEKLNDLLMNTEKEKNVQLNESLKKSLFDNSKVQTNKSNSRGTIGEEFLRDTVLNAFKDFENFELIDKSKNPHCGDIWLKFNSFTIMADSKNYIDNFVPKAEVDKLKHDMQCNKSIKIAWLVSMSRPISCYTNAPFIIDIIDSVIYCFINSLMECKEPEKLLLSAYFQCKLVYDKMINIRSGDDVIAKYEKNEKRVNIILKNIVSKSRDNSILVDSLKKNLVIEEKWLLDCLNEEIKNLEEESINIVKKWWVDNTVRNDSSKVKMLTNDIYKRFISCDDNKNLGIDGDMMKQIIRSIVGDDNIIFGKTEKGQLTISGYDTLVNVDKKRKLDS